MYKLCFYDNCCGPICDRTADFFTEDIGLFESVWFGGKVNEAQKKRYFRSKSGETVTDYYSDAPELNIFQQDENAEVLEERKYQLGERAVTLYNAYGGESTVYISSGEAVLRSLRFCGKNYLVGKYRLNGVCRQPLFKNYDLPENVQRAETYGNPIFLKNTPRRELWHDEKDPFRVRCDFPREEFAGDWLETCCYVTLGRPENPEPLPQELSDELIAKLMRDIPGESG